MAVIIIPTYFAGGMLHNCLESILKNVVSPEVLIFKNTLGWLQACNHAMSNTTGDVILLNDDTLLLTDIVQEMETLAYSNPKIGIVGGKSLTPDGQYVNNFGIRVAPDGNTSHRYYGELKDKIIDIVYQKAVEGSCMYIKRELINKIGLLDENYGQGYRGEVDYCFKAREVGYSVVSCPTAEYIHLVGQTSYPLNIQNNTYEYFMSIWGDKLATGKI
jgi:GT2 family glycosyltransferase